MASGHPSYTTFHAASVETLVKRLETPPINLSPSLVESLDIVCICTHVKTQSKNLRRLTEIDEILAVEVGLAKVKKNPIFLWDALTGVTKMNSHSYIFDRISKRAGISHDELVKEMSRRAKLLAHLAKIGKVHFKAFNRIVKDYYQDADKVLKQYNIV